VRWTRPEFDVVKGTNIVHLGTRDSTTVWLDPDDADPQRRYKLWRSHSDAGRWGLSLHFSADGIHWSERVLRTGICGDRTTVSYTPFRKRWVYTLASDRRGRTRSYFETADLLNGPKWDRIDDAPLWCGSDDLDPQREDLKTVCQLYNLDCVA